MTQDGAGRLTLSYSQAKSFRTCRKQYWFDALSGEQPPPDEPGEAGLIGQAVHRAMRVLGETDRPELARAALDAYVRMPAHRELVGEGTSAHDTLIEIYEAGVEAHAEIGGDREERLVEKTTAAPSPDRTFWLLRARLDRADLLADGTWQIIDWKTNRWENAEETDEQLDIAHAAFRICRPRVGDGTVRTVAWNLRTGAIRTRVLSAADAEAALATFGELAARIAGNRDWDAEPGPHCSFCRWRARCPESELRPPG